MSRGVVPETRAVTPFLTARHYTAPGVESLQARQWTGWATDRGHPAFAVAPTTTPRCGFPIGRVVVKPWSRSGSTGGLSEPPELRVTYRARTHDSGRPGRSARASMSPAEFLHPLKGDRRD